MTKLSETAQRWMNRVTKWRTLFTGWQLGTRPKGDPEADAVRDLRELTICLRVEVNALIGILHKQGIVTSEQWISQLIDEAQALDKSFEARFPGFKSSDDGLIMTLPDAAQTMKGWKP